MLEDALEEAPEGVLADALEEAPQGMLAVVDALADALEDIVVYGVCKLSGCRVELPAYIYERGKNDALSYYVPCYSMPRKYLYHALSNVRI